MARIATLAVMLTLENALIKFPLLSEHECLAISHTCAIFILRSEALTFDECSQELKTRASDRGPWGTSLREKRWR